jgi:hypothetical protein
VRLTATVFRVDLRVAAADRLPLVERFALPRRIVVRFRVADLFFVDEGFLRLGRLAVVPVTVSAMLLAALDKPSVTASMPVFAASVMVPRTPSSLSLSMLLTSLPVILVSVTLSLGAGQPQEVQSSRP